MNKTIKLSALFKDLEGTWESFRELECTDISCDSRAVRPGDVFVAIPGTRFDGGVFLAEALEKGARACVVSSDVTAEGFCVPVFKTPNVRKALAQLAAQMYPRQPPHIAAVTGTSGKTSVVTFAQQIWSMAGKRSASLGTIGVTTDAGTQYGSLTTPDPVSLHACVDDLARQGVTHLALEASSHGLDQHRLDGLRLCCAVFTNLGRDHMDYHTSAEDYFQAKARLFSHLLPCEATAVADPSTCYGARIIEIAKTRRCRIFSCGWQGKDIRIEHINTKGLKQSITLNGRYGAQTIEFPLIGQYQVENAITAAGVALAGGLEAEAVFSALSRLKNVPGRLEQLDKTPPGSAVFIDYAHKPDALESVLKTLRPFVGNRLIVLFGAGGDRDKGKRPLMGAIAARLADVVIITDDNPRHEPPADIRADILQAAPEATEIGDRAEAISYAIGLLEHGDVLVLAGKGHETGQIIGDDTIAFNDKKIAHSAIAQRWGEIK